MTIPLDLEAILKDKNSPITQCIQMGDIYRKRQLTLLRNITEEEDGEILTTFVIDKETKQIRSEVTNVIDKSTQIFARNPDSIGKNDRGEPVYNEWLIPKYTAIKNYGHEAINSLDANGNFQALKKKVTIQAVLIEKELLYHLKAAECVEINNKDNSLNILIKVSWSQEPMCLKIGDYLTTAGYGISQADMKGYEMVNPQIKAEPEEDQSDKAFRKYGL